MSELTRERSQLTDTVKALESAAAAAGAAGISELSRQADAEQTVSQSRLIEAENQCAAAQELLAAQNGELDRLKADMTKKLNESQQFQEMTGILGKKNAQIKDLRKRLSHYEGDAAESAGESGGAGTPEGGIELKEDDD